MDIYDIRIMEITEQYLSIIEQMKQLDLDVAGEFLLMAATLMHIKSRMLLPSSEEIEEEEGKILVPNWFGDCSNTSATRRRPGYLKICRSCSVITSPV